MADHLVYTAEEAADCLKVNQRWLERKAAAREIPFTMLGGNYHFTPNHLTQIITMFETTPQMKTSAPARQRRTTNSPLMVQPTELRPRPRQGPIQRKSNAA